MPPNSIDWKVLANTIDWLHKCGQNNKFRARNVTRRHMPWRHDVLRRDADSRDALDDVTVKNDVIGAIRIRRFRPRGWRLDDGLNLFVSALLGIVVQPVLPIKICPSFSAVRYENQLMTFNFICTRGGLMVLCKLIALIFLLSALATEIWIEFR